jgi:hypothetical protein
MPITYTIDKQRRFILRIISGAATSDEILASLAEVLKHPDYHPGMKSLTDLRAIQHYASPQEVRQIANFILGREEEVRGGKAAIVVSQDVSFGMARMLEMLTESSQLSIRVFKNLKEAYEWLEIEAGCNTVSLSSQTTG